MKTALLVLPSTTFSAQPGWFGPKDGWGGADALQNCINNANFQEYKNADVTTFMEEGLDTSTCFKDDCLTWGSTGEELCSKVFGQTCLAVLDEQQCAVVECSKPLYYLEMGGAAWSRAAYCNVQCPQGTHHSALTVL